MENYTKGKNIEEPLERHKIPISNLSANFVWMQVNGGSKMEQLLKYALAEFPKSRKLIWTSSGAAVSKAVSCAEIMKKKYNNSLYQITKICFQKVEEYWDPLIENLDQLVVHRKLPVIHILLSMDPLNTNELGYQAPVPTVTKNAQTVKTKPEKIT